MTKLILSPLYHPGLTPQNPSSYLGVQGFVSYEECDHLLSLALDKPDKYMVFGNISGDGRKHAGFGATNVFRLPRGQDEVISRIEDRISAWTFLPKENGEDMLIFNYRVEAGSGTQVDLGQDNTKKLIDGDLGATVLIFFSNVSSGGEIIFPKSVQEGSQVKTGKGMFPECTSSSNLAVKHVKSNALLVFNLHPNATKDEGSLLGGCSVLDGEKWSAVKRIHVRRFNRSKSLSSDSQDECTDEDENCGHWAAAGECQRNPVYMLGTLDYYGTCRKSCGVC